MRSNWSSPRYSKTKVDYAGKVLVGYFNTQNDISEDNKSVHDAFVILNNWRSAHSYPLFVFQRDLRKYARKITNRALVVQRLKRIKSIIKKLRRTQTQTMNLSQMQDIGGCRVILEDIKEVNKFYNIYTKRKTKHKLIKEKNYITSPKLDGYRGVHLIYRYKGQITSKFDGLLIEIQIRSKLQHAWATAVETVDIFTNQSLKTDEGNSEWIEFFKLVSSAFALMEETKLIHETPNDKEELRNKIREKITNLNIFEKMESWRILIGKTDKRSDSAFFLLKLDSSSGTTYITEFKRSQEKIAVKSYNQTEEKNNKNTNIISVLVAASSLKEVKKAYPNYLADTSEFIKAVNRFLDRY